MQWIKYQIVQSVVDDETILIEKKIGYSEANLVIAQTEAYNGQYTIEEDSESYDKNPITIEFGGTGAKDSQTALTNLGAMPRKLPSVYISASTTLTSDCAEKPVLVNSSSDVTITIPTNTNVAFEVGTMVTICNIGTGTVTFAAASGVTFNTKKGARVIDGQYAAVTLYKEADNVWYGWGALA